MRPEQFADALRQAVRALDFAATADAWQGAAPLGLHPGIDLAVVAFPPGGAPVWANVLFSPEQPGGVVAAIGTDAGPVQNIRFDRDQRDQRDAQGESMLWRPGADWSQNTFTPLWSLGAAQATRFVAPYPASLLKLMVAVGVGLAVDEGLCDWPEALEPMITVSDNAATDRCVALLHRVGWLDSGPDNRPNRTNRLNRLNQHFSALGLHTLQMHGTQPDGGWRNADGAGVGQIHMTAWDTLRLLWLLDAEAPSPPWLPADTPPLLQPATRAQLRTVLQAQQLNEVLSSVSLRGLPGWVPGGPDAPRFAHKTGTTDNYASDAGIVRALPDGRGHCLVAVLSTLGRRYAPHERCATTWRLPALGAAVQALVESLT